MAEMRRCTLRVSSKLLIMVLLIFSQTQADSSACKRKEKQLASLDLAKEAISIAKDLLPICVNGSNDVECVGKEEVSAYLEFALKMIGDAKENSFICDEANNHTNVTEEADNHTNVTKKADNHTNVTDEANNHTNVTEEANNHTNVTDEANNHTNVTDEANNHKNVTYEANNHTNVTDEGEDISRYVVHGKPTDCYEILKNGETRSGEYVIWPRNPQIGDLRLKVYCDMDTDGGGWTVIQRRGVFQNQVNFFRNWEDYKHGFGNISEEFWLGNDNIFALTNQGNYTLRFDMENVNREQRFAIYSSFWIEYERTDYRLHFDSYSGTAGDGIKKHKNRKFATKDKENGNPSKCAATRLGGWWYENCGYSNPNGINFAGGTNLMRWMNWHPFTGYDSLRAIEMKIR